MRLGVLLVVFAFGCGGGSVPEQLGEACTDISEAFCDRAIDCGLIDSGERLTCVNELFGGCCADDGTCNSDVDPSITADDYDRCLGAIDTQRCADLSNGNIPSECLRL